MSPRSLPVTVRFLAVALAGLTVGPGLMGALPTAHGSPSASPAKDAHVRPGASTAAAKKAEDKLTTGIRRALEKKPTADFWVRFADAPDLDAATEITDWAERGRYVVDALQAAADASQSDVVARLKAEDVEYESYWAANAIHVEDGDEELATALAADAEVTAIAETTRFEVEEPAETGPAEAEPAQGAEWGVEAIHAPEVWAQGITGQGITVANLDSGVDVTHPALAATYRGTRPDGTITGDYSWWEPGTYCEGTPCDAANHGTHTMGTMVGDTAEDHIGVAPGARWIASNALAYGDEASLLAAAQWFLAPTRTDGTAADPAQRPHIINNSWGKGSLAYSAVMPQVLDAWEAAGIFDVWSNGNDGPLCVTTPRPGGNAGAYSVGAYDVNGEIATFSSRGDGPDGTVKPDIAAPGVDVRSAQPGGGYMLMSGTSMAAPHLTGAVALLWSAAPSLVGDIDATRALLDETAHDVDDTSCGGTADDNNVWGEGTLDVAALVAAAPTESALVDGTLLGPDGAVLDGATVTVDEDDDAARSVAPDGEGRFTLRVAPGDHTVTARAPGYLPVTSSVTVPKGGTARLDLTLETAPRYALTGTVTDSTGAKIAGATLTVSAPGAPTVSTTAGDDGAYRLADVPLGAYTLQITGDRCTAALTDRLDVTGDTVRDVTLDRARDATGYTCTVGTAGARQGDTPLEIGSDELATTKLPFSFPFYGKQYDELTVSDNGWVSFLPQTYATFNPFPIPDDLRNPHASVFAYLAPLVLDGGAGVYTASTTVDGTDAFVVEWRDARLSWSEARTTFSATLYADGRVELGYGANTDPVWLGGMTTIGIENADGTDAWQYVYNVPGTVHDGLSIQFARPAWGTVTGTLTNALDHQPVADVEVRLVPAGGGTARSVWTGSDGSYTISAPLGEYDVSIAPQHYERVTERVEFAEDLQELTVSPELRTGAAAVLGGDWDWRLVQGQEATTDVTLWNFGTAPMSATVGTAVPLSTLDGPPSTPSNDTVTVSPAVVSKPGAERAPSSRGTEIGQIYASTNFPVGVGLDPDGALWVSDVDTLRSRNVRYARTGEQIDEHDARVDSGDRPYALTWDTTIDAMCQSVLRADGASAIRCYDDQHEPIHELTGEWSHYPAYGIAHDPERDVFYVALPGIGEIVTVAGTTHSAPGELLDRCTPESRDPVGLALNPTSGTLWMSSNWADRAFIQLDPADCSTLRTVAAPAGVIDGAVYDLETDVTGALWAMDNATHRVRLVEVGDPLLTPVSWVSSDKAAVTLDPMTNAPVRLTIDTAGLAPGTYTTDVAVASTSGRAPLSRFMLTLEVVAPYAAAVDVGGPGLTDGAGAVWASDRALGDGAEPDDEPAWGWTGTSDVATTKKAIAGTDDDALFRTARTGEVAYTFRDVPEGDFDLDLGLVELASNPKPGKRVVDVLVDGQVVLESLDVAAEAGGLTALTRTVTVEHDGGDLQVSLRPRTKDHTPGLATLRLQQRSLGD